MRQTKLICFEGMPGSGKSTFSRFVSLQAERNQHEITWYHEIAKPHPTSFFHVACMKRFEYEEICEQFPQAKATLDSIRTTFGQQVSIDLSDLERRYSEVIGEEIYQAIARYSIDLLPVERYIEVALDKWQHFAEQQIKTDQVAMLDASLFQYQVYGLLLKNWPKQQIKDFVRQLFTIIAPLEPVLIHLYQKDFDQAFAQLLESRGDAFATRMVERDQMEPFYQVGESQGVPRYFQLLQEVRALMLELFAEAPFQKLSIENSGREWKKYEQAILDFLDLLYMPDPAIAKDEMEAVVGTYYNQALDLHIQINLLPNQEPAQDLESTQAQEQHQLRIEFAPDHIKRLLPKSELVYSIIDNSVDIHFDKTGDKVTQFTIGGMPITPIWAETGLEFIKVD